MTGFYEKNEWIFIAALAVIPQIAAYLVWNGLYCETDSYSHAVRVLNLFRKDALIDIGVAYQYTWLTDLFWAASSLPFMFFIHVKQSVFYGGVLFHALTAAAAAIAFVWALRPFFGSFLRLLAVGLFFSLPASNAIYAFARPDHHTLTSFFAILMIGGLLHFIKFRTSFYLAFSGVMAGFLLWTSVEGVLVAYALLAALTVLWLWNRVSAADIARVCFVYFAAATVFWLIDPPKQGLFFPDNGRLSVLFVALIGLTATAFKVLTVLERRRRPLSVIQKLLWLAGLGGLFFGALLMIFGTQAVFAPFFPPEIKKIWSEKVSELAPGIKNQKVFISVLLPSLISIFFGFSVFFQSGKEQKTILILTGIPLALFTAMTFFSSRYDRDSAVFLPYPLLICFQLWAQEKEQKGTPFKHTALFTGVFYVLILAYTSSLFRWKEEYAVKYDFQETAAYLNPKAGVILSEVFSGPALMWETDRLALGSPMHRNIEGIRATHSILNGADEEKALNLLKNNNISDIVIPFEKQDEAGHPLSKVLGFSQRMQILMYTEGETALLKKLVMDAALPCGIKKAPENDGNLVFHVDFSDCPAK